jgi:CheY-like chemotaxis protein
VRLHGGTVEAHSDGAGKGSELVVRLPRARVPAEVTTPASSIPSATMPRQLLIIDDNEDAAVSLGDLLTAFGHSVQIVHHPTEALRFFARKPPDVALVDIGLPTMDGYELARRLRAQPGGELTRLIAVTGYGQASDRAKAKAAGFDAHLVKPVDPQRLEALITSLYSTSSGTS